MFVEISSTLYVRVYLPPMLPALSVAKTDTLQVPCWLQSPLGPILTGKAALHVLFLPEPLGETLPEDPTVNVMVALCAELPEASKTFAITLCEPAETEAEFHL